MCRKLIIPLLIIVATYGLADSTNYYVLKSGNDSNTGTSWATAWATIPKVNSTIRAADTVRFGSGRWLNSQINAVAGTFGHPTVYACSTLSPATFGLTTISTGDSVRSWTLHSGNIYKAYWRRSSSIAYGMDNYDVNKAYILVCNDSTLYPQTSLGNVSAAGQFYQNSSTDTVYAWFWGNASPAGKEILIAGGPTLIVSADRDYITFVGLNFKMGKQGVLEVSARSDSLTFIHCLFQHNANRSTVEANNPSLAFFGEHYYPNRYIKFIACDFRDCYRDDFPDQTAAWDHGGTGIKFYYVQNSVMDSCTFLRCAGDAIKFKSSRGAYSINNAIRNCIFYGNSGGANTSITNMGVMLSMRVGTDSVYGCTFIACGKGIGVGDMGAAGSDFPQESNNFIANNTFYNCGYFLEIEGMQQLRKEYFKYNCAYNYIGARAISFAEQSGSYANLQDSCVFDSNYWYDPTSFAVRLPSGTLNWAGWQAIGKDLRSSWTVNPGFNNPAAYDFSRPSAPQEMNVTYGGRTWTRYGAWQGPATPDTTDPVISNVRTTDTAATTVIVRWNTNEYTNSRVEYGLTTGYGTLTTLDPSLVTIHAQTLTGLTNTTTYHYRVRSADGSGNETISGDYTFTTLTPDITPPIITDVQVTGLTSSAATIGWTTNELSNSQVNYGLTSSYGQSSALNSTMVLNHQVALGGLTANTDYHYRVRSSDAVGNERLSGDYIFHTDTISTAYANLALDMTPTVSSSYTGYTITPITDGTIAPRGGTGTTWASSESPTSPHWVEFNFGRQVMVNRMVISWAYNGGRAAFMCARQYYVQYDSSGTFVTRATVNNTTNDSAVTTDFAPIVTNRIRYYQPANMGSALYPTVVWVTEMEIYGTNAVNDSIAPAAPSNVRGTPGVTLGSIDLQWTAPDDPLNLGQASNYTMKYSPAPIIEGNWDEAEVVLTPPLPLPGGLVQNFNVGGLSEGQIYYFALKAADAFGNTSEISNSDSSFACGIMAPVPLTTTVDTSALTATFSAGIVQSYLPVYYEFSLDTLAQFSNPRYNVDFAADSAASAGFDQLITDKTYYWRCRTRSSSSSDSSAWSQYIQFRVSSSGEAAALSSADCLYPREGNIISTTQPTFTVRKVSGLFEVYIEIDDDAQFGSAIQSGLIAMPSTGDLNWKLPVQLESKVDYYWRASADNIVWTNPISFSAIPKIHVFPNPFNAANGDNGVTFTNLPQNSDITISTISGANIKRANDVGPNDWQWDTKNDSGNDVAPGVYMYFVDYGDGSASGKVIIAR